MLIMQLNQGLIHARRRDHTPEIIGCNLCPSWNTPQPVPRGVLLRVSSWSFVFHKSFFCCFRQVRPPSCRADHTGVKQSEIDNPFATLVSRRG